MTETRKLAAILAADVAGYSLLAGADEERTLARLRALRSDLIDPAIAVHHGRVVKRTGDGLIVEFRSVVDAVRCAIDVRHGMAERNAGVAPARRIEFRIGIHLGDIVEEADGDLMGDGVNIAARLEGIAEPGAICLSEDAYRQVRDRVKETFVDLGEKALKNIARPVRAYSLPSGVRAEATVATRATPAKLASSKRPLTLALLGSAALLIVVAQGGWHWFFADRPASSQSNAAPTAEAKHLSIVVLPFANLSGDASQDYFADGITENLTTDLSRLVGSFVIARNTAFTFKGKSVDAKEIGRELGVRYVLEGSVQRDQGRVRVNVQLIDAESGNHLWAERFDKPLADLLDTQDEIVSRLANQLGTELIAAEAQRGQRASNPDSMDLYFQGMAWFNKGFSRENLAQARGFFERALALDPGNVDAMVGAAGVDSNMGYFTDDRAGVFARAEATLTKALYLAPNNADAHFFMGLVLINSNRAAQGIPEFERVLALDPNYAAAHAMIAMANLYSGRAEESEGHVNDALRLSPLDVWAWAWMNLEGGAKLHLGADQEAVAWLHRSIEAYPNFSTPHFFLAAALANLGKLEEARAEAKAGLALDPKFTIHQFRVGAESDNPVFLKQRERLIEGIRKAGIPEG